MKIKLVVLFAIAFMTASCNMEPPKQLITKRVSDGLFAIVEIDSCEYVLSHVHYGNSITHKGNCKNPIHDCK